MASTPSLIADRGRVRFINIRNIYASSNKEIRLTLEFPDGSQRDYEFTASFGNTFLDIRRGDVIELLWRDEKDTPFHGIKNLRTGVTYAVPAGCLLPVAVAGLLATVFVGFTLSAIRIGSKKPK